MVLSYSQRFTLKAARTECVRLFASVCLVSVCLSRSVCLFRSVCLGQSVSVCLFRSASICLSRSVSLSVSVGQDTRTNTPAMSIVQCPPGCIAGIANVYFRSHGQSYTRYHFFIDLQNASKTFKNTPNERPSPSLLSGLIQQLSCGLVKQILVPLSLSLSHPGHP